MAIKRRPNKPVYIYIGDDSGTISSKEIVIQPIKHRKQIIIANYENDSSYWQV